MISLETMKVETEILRIYHEKFFLENLEPVWTELLQKINRGIVSDSEYRELCIQLVILPYENHQLVSRRKNSLISRLCREHQQHGETCRISAVKKALKFDLYGFEFSDAELVVKSRIKIEYADWLFCE